MSKTASNFVTDDDIILLNLRTIASVKKYEKLKFNGVLLSVDDRNWLQGIRRWWSGDGQEITIQVLMDCFMKAKSRVEYLKKNETKTNARLLKQYINLIYSCKIGVENLKFYSYTDNLVQSQFDIILNKIQDMTYLFQNPSS